jgi:nucleotidyltransferase substrate binding protein (TIGR01987 family)
MDRLTQLLDQAERALASLEEAVALEAPSALERDGAIQRFEFTFEISWKACQRFLHERDGVQCASPKSCLRAAAACGLLSKDQGLDALAMCDDRKMTTHTYNEEVAVLIHRRLPSHVALIASLLSNMRGGLSTGAG